MDVSFGGEFPTPNWKNYWDFICKFIADNLSVGVYMVLVVRRYFGDERSGRDLWTLLPESFSFFIRLLAN